MLLDTTIDNWPLCTERQAIYNIHSIDSSNEIIQLLEYLRLSLGLTYTPLFFFVFFFCMLFMDYLGKMNGEALKNS